MNGPPGCGKTALVSSYLASRNLPCLWYQLDSADDDTATFIHSFTLAARNHLPATGASLPDFEPGTAPDLARFARHYFRELYSALATPLIVVLDNYHELAESSPSHDLVRIACEETPESCHVVIASRAACPKSLARMRYNHALAVIGAEELLLTLDETRGVAESHGVKLPSEAATVDVQTRCAGWVMGLVLLLARPRATGDGHEEPAFEYFSAEVFGKLDADSRDWLMQCALLPRMTVPTVTGLTGTPKAGALLLDLMRRNHFVASPDSNALTLQFHPLFREYLLKQRMKRFADVELVSQYEKAAQVLILEGDHEAALALLYWHARGKTSSDASEALAMLKDAYQRFSSTDDLRGMALAWSSLAETIFSSRGDLRQIDSWLAEFSAKIEGRLEQLPADLCARVALAMFIALSLRPPLHANVSLWRERVRMMLESETRASERPRLRQHLVTHHLLRGEHAEAESVLCMLHYADQLPAAERPSRTPVDHINEAMVAMHVGMAERGQRAVAEGLRAVEGAADRGIESVLLQLGAVMALNRGELARADTFLAAFERLAETTPSVDRRAYYGVAAWRKFQMGESTLALQLLSRAVAASEARSTPYYIAIDTLGFGLLLHLCGRTSEAQCQLEAARKVGSDIGNPLIEYAYQLFVAYLALDLGEEQSAREHLASGMRLGRQHGYRHFFFFPPPVMVRLCLAALEAGVETAYVRSLIERNALTPDPSWRQAESWPWPLRIYTLGRFGVVRQGNPLRFSGKAQKKPLELLKALIAFGGRDVSEARLADALWPGAEGDAAAQALATTLFRLRKLVGEQVIRRQDSRLTLDPAHCWVDCWAFERLSSDEARDSPTRIEKLRKLHQGPFLDGTDAPWAGPMRERLHAKLSRLLRTFTGTVLLGVSTCEDANLFSGLLLEVLA